MLLVIFPRRLYTLIGVKRRGVPPQSIIEFINTLGVTTTNSIIQSSRFEQTVRNYLERTVPRLMLVMDPVPVVIEDASPIEVAVPFSPKDPAMGSRTVKNPTNRLLSFLGPTGNIRAHPSP